MRKKWVAIIWLCLLIGLIAGKCSRESDRVGWFENNSEIPDTTQGLTGKN